MSILNLKHLQRYKEITLLAIKYGRSDFVKELGKEIELPEHEKLKTENAPKPEELAEDLEKMGPVFVKLGQLMSTETTFMPDAYVEALGKLQDRAQPFCFEDVKGIFQEELNVEIKSAFTSFEEEPIAAASLAQVHRAVLRSTGRVVAVKVQRPDIQKGILQDLEILEELAQLVETKTTWGKNHGIINLVEQLKTTLLAELDYKQEKINLIAFKKNLEQFTLIDVPSPIEDYSSSRVLTMDFLSGQNISHLSRMFQIELDGDKLAKELFSAYLKQIILDGLVHADPHPGNVYLTEDNHLAIMDLGMVVRISPQMQTGILKLLLAMSEGRGEEVAQILVRLGRTREDYDEYVFQEKISNLVSQYLDLNLAQIAFGRVFIEIETIAAENGVLLPNHFRLLGKALLNLDKIGKLIAPNFIPNEAVKEQAVVLLKQRMRKNFSKDSLYRNFAESAELLQGLPSKLNHTLDMLSRNKIKIEVDALDEDKLMTGFEKVANRITLGLVLAALILGAALMMRIETTFTVFGYPGIAMLFFLAAALCGIALVIRILISDAKDKKRKP